MGAKLSRRVLRKTGTLAVAVAAGVSLLGGGLAAASNHARTTDKDIPNLGLVKNQIKEYYGDTVVDGEHYASADSDYAKQVGGIEKRAGTYLAHAKPAHGKKPAVVFDVDDTTLLTYNYDAGHDFGYDPVTNADWVNAQKGDAVFGMPDLVTAAKKQGYTVFFVTGRPESQRSATAGNLHKVGYKTAAGPLRLFLKNPDNPPAYLPCGATCTTIEYKSYTRKHIESRGYDIVANFGDQFSDLKGGYANRTFKIPNPMYYLP